MFRTLYTIKDLTSFALCFILQIRNEQGREEKGWNDKNKAWYETGQVWSWIRFKPLSGMKLGLSWAPSVLFFFCFLSLPSPLRFLQLFLRFTFPFIKLQVRLRPYLMEIKDTFACLSFLRLWLPRSNSNYFLLFYRVAGKWCNWIIIFMPYGNRIPS